MTSIEVLSDKEIGVDEFAATMRSRFAEVFGYRESVDRRTCDVVETRRIEFDHA